MPQEATGGQTVGDGIQDTSLTGVMPAGAVTIHPSQYPGHLQVALAHFCPAAVALTCLVVFLVFALCFDCLAS